MTDPRGPLWRKNNNDHTCHWPGCDERVPARLWGCKRHWFTLPPRIREKIVKHYRRGQERSRDPSPEYIAAAKEAREWCLKHINGAENDSHN